MPAPWGPIRRGPHLFAHYCLSITLFKNGHPAPQPKTLYISEVGSPQNEVFQDTHSTVSFLKLTPWHKGEEFVIQSWRKYGDDDISPKKKKVEI